MARANAPSVPGRMGTHSCALEAVYERFGSTTTSLAPRSIPLVKILGRCAHLVADKGFQPKISMYLVFRGSMSGLSSPMRILKEAFRPTSQRLECML